MYLTSVQYGNNNSNNHNPKIQQFNNNGYYISSDYYYSIGIRTNTPTPTPTPTRTHCRYTFDLNRLHFFLSFIFFFLKLFERVVCDASRYMLIEL